jgi:type III restriction enzyme
MDLSATPFFLSGSGYAEGTLFPWTMSDFSLMDAIECGIVKLPRVPVADNIPGEEMPVFRNLWEHIRKDMPKKGRGTSGDSTPQAALALQTALLALYGHYEKTYKLWEEAASRCRPASSSCARTPPSPSWSTTLSRASSARTMTAPRPWKTAGWRCSATLTKHGNPLPRPNTLLIDSEQLEAGDALDDNFRGMAADEIERFRKRSSSAVATPDLATTLPTRSCCAR